MAEQNAPPALSTPDIQVIQRQPAVKPQNARSQLSDVQCRVTYEIERTLSEIRKHRYTRVALQFPDSMLGDASQVFRLLQTSAKHGVPETVDRDRGTEDEQALGLASFDVKFFILGDTSYGACCVDEIAAEHSDADVVVHYGRSCLSPTSRIPAIYVFTQQPLDEQRLLGHFKSFYEDLEQKIILMADVTYQHHLPSIQKHLEEQGYTDLFLTEVVHDPSSPLPNRTVPGEVQADPSRLKGWQLFHVSDPPEALLLILSSRISDVQIYSSSYTAGDTYNIVEPSAVRALSRRYALLTSVSTVAILGILINTLSVKNYLHVVEHVKSQILAAGKKSYTFVVGKVNAAKIANFSEVGAWVVVGCWESSLIDGKDFWKPVITPFELELALKSDDERVWTGEWSSDFQRVLNESKASKRGEKGDGGISGDVIDAEGDTTDAVADGGELDSQSESAPPDFDLRSGRYVSQTRPMRVTGGNAEESMSHEGLASQTIALRAKGDMVAIGNAASPGADFLQSKRTWKGLGSDFEIAYEENGGTIEPGRGGIARGYTYDGAQMANTESHGKLEVSLADGKRTALSLHASLRARIVVVGPVFTVLKLYYSIWYTRVWREPDRQEITVSVQLVQAGETSTGIKPFSPAGLMSLAPARNPKQDQACQAQLGGSKSLIGLEASPSGQQQRTVNALGKRMPKSQTIASPLKSRNSPASKSLLARIAAPFSSNQRSPLDQEIRLDEPFRKYFAGDTIKGAVLLTASKALRITHLVVRLHGFVKVVNNARLPGETIPYDENLLTSSKKKKGIEYFGNGFARLFEDERVLCGDGRLSGRYEFRFELDLPSTGVPSGIDFEHGTISYLLTSTLTRPSTISPTLTVHHKLNVTGTIDIAHLEPPKPRVVSLEAVSQKTKTRLQMRRRSTPLPNGKTSKSPSLDGNPTTRVSSPSPNASDIPPQSPVPSTVSSVSTGQSTTSACNHLRAIHSQDADGSNERLGSDVQIDRTITIKTELLHGGCLPGDTLPIHINIDHMKPVKTMQGLIITVFRQGRIDTHPALPLGSTEKGSKRQYEDYYPKSRTGLGGLSLSSAGSSRVFRQDLAQTITPLIVDPQTLNAFIKTSIQMPDHAFPTITGVPGEMISFKYFVEIVIDLRGKLAGQDRFLPNLSITNAPQYSYGEPKISKLDGIDGVRYSATPGFNYLITDQIRRTKGVIFTTTEVIVGTRDSARSRARKWENSDDSEQIGTFEGPQKDGDQQNEDTTSPTTHADASSHESQPESRTLSTITRTAYQADLFRPPSTIDEPQDEKSQIRRAEERLLPSSPPQDGESSATIVAPAVPFAHDEEDFISRYAFGAVAPAYDEASAPSPNPQLPFPPPQVPHGAMAGSQERPSRPGDDKQEMELHRLQAQRSAPEDNVNGEPQVGHPLPVPSASASCEDDPSSAAPPSTLGVVQMVQAAQQEDDHQPQQAQVIATPEVPTSHPSSPPRQQQQTTSHAITPSAPTLEEVEAAHINDAHDNHDHDEIDDTNNDDDEHLPGYTR